MPGSVLRLSATPGEEQGEVLPGVLPGTVAQGALERRDDGAELAVVDADEDGAAGVGAAGLGPAAGDDGEVLDVEGDEDPCFGGGEGEQLLVAVPVELALVVGGADVVPDAAQGACDPGTGDVGVEEEPQGGSGAGSWVAGRGARGGRGGAQTST